MAVGSALATTVLLLTGCTVASSAAGSCAQNEVELGDSDLRPGGSVQLSVDWMYRSCEDTGTTRASDDVTVTITPAATGRSVLLGRRPSARRARSPVASPCPRTCRGATRCSACTRTTVTARVPTSPW